MWSKVSRLVSGCCLMSDKQKWSTRGGGEDVDISYITDRILAMASPMKAMDQDPVIQAKEFLETRHRKHYMVFNLCMEQDDYPFHCSSFVEQYPFDDNRMPSLSLIKEFCQSVDWWLSSDPNNVVFIMCMAGKGRIGLMVFCYLVYRGMLAEEVLQVFANERNTINLGMMIPSQRRYVNYWQKSLSFPEGRPAKVILPKPTSRELWRIRLYDAKNTESIFFIVSELQAVPRQLYRLPADACRNFCRKIKNSYGEIEEEEEDAHICLDYCFLKTVQVTGDVCVTFYEKNTGGHLFYACFNTAFIENNSIQFSIMELDKVGNKGKLIAGLNFHVELSFGPANPTPYES